MIFLKHKDLARLVEQAQKGDDQAFQKIYEHTASVQYFQLRQIMADPNEAQDALQETYFLLYQNIDKIKPPAALIAYLNRLSYYVGKNLSRRAETFHKRNVDIDEATCVSDPASNLHSTIEKKEFTGQIRSALEELPEQERLILSMRYYQNQTLQQIAYSMNISLSTVKRIQRTAKRRLKSKLERQGILHWTALVPQIASSLDISVHEQSLPALNSVSSQCSGITVPDSLLKSRPPAHLISGTAGMALVKSAVLMVCITGTAAVGAEITPSPSITQVKAPEAFTAAPARIDVTVSSLIPLKSVRIASNSGHLVTLSAKTDCTYTGNISENGSYTLTAETIAGKKEEKNINISCIDTEYPEIVSVDRITDGTEIIFRDNETGIDFESLYCESENGTITFPSSVDTALNRAVFNLPKENNKISFSDKAGNTCKIRLKLKELEHSEIK